VNGTFLHGFHAFHSLSDPPLSERRNAVTVAQKEQEIQRVLDSIRPAIQADGGDVELLGFDEGSGVVRVRLMGACESCPISMMTLKQGIEKRVMSAVPGVAEVVAV
jgi:Fe-S cluster biogenesis protein NfuA